MTIIDGEAEMVNWPQRPSFNAGEHARKFDKVYIMGMAATHALAPADALEEAEVWKINEAYRLDEYYDRKSRATRWFQFHQRWDFTRRKNVDSKGTDHWTWLRKPHAFPIYMQQKWEDIPNSVAFPLDDIVRDLLGEAVPYHFNFFRNSLAYLIAFATWLGFKEVGIYGWELASDTELKYERPSALFWLGGLAARIGADNIELPIGSKLLAGGHRRYAYDDVPAVNRMHIESSLGSVRTAEFEAQVKLRRNPDDELAKEMFTYLSGMRAAYERLIEELDDVSDPRGTFHEEASTTADAHGDIQFMDLDSNDDTVSM